MSTKNKVKDKVIKSKDNILPLTLKIPEGYFLYRFLGRNKETKWVLLLENYNQTKRRFVLINQKAYKFYKLEYFKKR